ncbi:Hypothetical predicted protein [Mytilus galloprovincialis]|uniref:Uncharacterized protein n=1 Tax=Mytilus galloprovincialis TaxID=29158 RepID=A0A8B6HHG8_MYTGA|nr:Hypothetical predicted protein [Mytilus galloprovincialis]
MIIKCFLIDPPSDPSFVVNQGIPLFEANITELRCSVSDTGNPTSVFTWMWNHTNIPISVSNTLQIGPMQKADNGAVVTCRAKNSYSERKGLKIQINKSLNVEYYPLVILEDEIIGIVEGQTLSVKCIVIGNPVPTAKWFKQGQNNPLFGGKQELNLTKKEVDRNDSGHYFCEAISPSVQYGNLSNSAYIELKVNYPPDVSIEKISDHEDERTVVYLCNATGMPKTYTYTGWEQTYNDIVIRSSYQLASFTSSDNRSVTLSHLSYQDSGNYTCSVNNGVPDRNGELRKFGKEQLHVKGSPELINSLPPDETFSTNRGGNITVDLRFFTFPNITKIYWYNVSSNSSIETDNRQDVTTFLQMKHIETTFHGITVNISNFAYHAVLQLTNFTTQMEGTYILVVRNGFQDRNISFKALISSKPEDPTDLNVTDRTSTKITVLWNRGYNGGHIQHFNISVADNTGIRNTKLVFDDFNRTQMFTLTDLSPATDYVIRLYAQNKIDKSNAIQINATTVESEGEDGLKDNILYESAGPNVSPTQGTSGVVTKNKDKHKLSEESKTQETALDSDVIRKPRNELKGHFFFQLLILYIMSEEFSYPEAIDGYK